MPSKPIKPTTLKEAIQAIDDLLSEEDRKVFTGADDPRQLAYSVHHTLGQHLRNEFGLWHDSELAKHLREEHHIDHADDMSHYIIEAYIRRYYPSLWEHIDEDET